ncbi:hypothetical protein JZ751_009198 [Albula glossodonta]|uniref:Uncharacterized protein n=1 Tax=Albula glossodonta TaxID=121402 RepID=A0A8T2N0T5_9TELE|nr:hypothetical protein JZ751_009198 [Albula glossodonta]
MLAFNPRGRLSPSKFLTPHTQFPAGVGPNEVFRVPFLGGRDEAVIYGASVFICVNRLSRAGLRAQAEILLRPDKIARSSLCCSAGLGFDTDEEHHPFSSLTLVRVRVSVLAAFFENQNVLICSGLPSLLCPPTHTPPPCCHGSIEGLEMGAASSAEPAGKGCCAGYIKDKLGWDGGGIQGGGAMGRRDGGGVGQRALPLAGRTDCTVASVSPVLELGVQLVYCSTFQQSATKPPGSSAGSFTSRFTASVSGLRNMRPGSLALLFDLLIQTLSPQSAQSG